MVYNLVLKIIGVLDAILIIIGTLGNILIVFISYLNRENSTFVFLAALAINSTVSLYWWNLNHFVQPFWDVDLQNFNFYFCKIMNFFQFISSQSSAWFLVLISLDRLFKVKFLKKSFLIINTKKAFLIALSLTFFIILLNFHVLFTYGLILNSGNTTTTQCYSSPSVASSKIMDTWLIVSLFNFKT